jgi:hypothetical protein
MSETLAKKNPGATSHLRPRAIIRGTMVATDLPAMRRMLEELMGLEAVRSAPDRLLVRERGHRPGEAKHGQPYWVLEVKQVPEVSVPQEMLNHWGVELSSQAEVDRAYETCAANAERFELGRVQKPRFRNNSYAFYFVDRDSNWWEMEYRTPDLVYSALRARGDAVEE